VKWAPLEIRLLFDRREDQRGSGKILIPDAGCQSCSRMIPRRFKLAMPLYLGLSSKRM
jgi:hypothetical protein